ncbi:MAG: deoxynucleoside kinase [Flavobacteriaceae bacterium]|jgi:deoxyadenosine/deoxycytidine kinase|nr:deoxynucleoside kinase [Flavobacteriaceae bacterium]
MHLAITGNIGAGKTTLTQLLAKNYKWTAQYEDTEDNPYLDDFYYDMAKWSFNLQIYFLSSRFRRIKEIQESGKNIIQDRTIYEDAYIFAANLHDMGLMQTRDHNNYLNLFHLMKDYIQPPDLLIYLRASIPTLVDQIQKRGREYEASISIDYLNRLNDKYEEWIDNYKEGKLLIIETDNLEFVDNEADLGFIIDQIESQIHGLF